MSGRSFAVANSGSLYRLVENASPQKPKMTKGIKESNDPFLNRHSSAYSLKQNITEQFIRHSATVNLPLIPAGGTAQVKASPAEMEPIKDEFSYES